MLFQRTFLALQVFGLLSRQGASAFLRPSTTRSFATHLEAAKKPVPITLLSGFLGTGKTTALQHLLENTENKKIGVIVNDMASVNIDSKLVKSAVSGVLELQNGCACCSIADELFFSVEKLLKQRELDAIVVELSGVADPQAIKSNWNMAPLDIREMANIAATVTLLDAASFGYDYMTFDAAADREDWVDPMDVLSGNRNVAELLVEQVEGATTILVNKCDIASEDEITVTTKVAKALNPKAVIEKVQFGKIAPSQILGTFDKKEEAVCEDPECTDESHSHSHSHDHACNEPDCTDSSHSHSHDHAASCGDPDCTDSSHSHSHDHAASCNDPGCTDSSHSHSHEHLSCDDPDCTDSSHSHSHNHATSVESLGISSFVYKATRPFDSQRIMAMLNEWPVPIKDTLDLGLLNEAKNEGYMIGDKVVKGSPFVGVIRSKGFCWFAPGSWSDSGDPWRHDTAMYWSHAGKTFTISSAGKWWGSMDKEKMKKFFVDNMEEYERIIAEDFASEEFGDRRQEIVFIGTDIDEPKMRSYLDSCLLSDEEMATYRQKLQNYMDSLLSSTRSTGLFDTRGTEHLN